MEARAAMRVTRTKAWLAIGLLVAGMVPGNSARAEDYPSRPIQVIVPFAGGSASDVVTRILLDRMARTLGQSFVVDNRPGAGTVLPSRHRGAWRSRQARTAAPSRAG